MRDLATFEGFVSMIVIGMLQSYAMLMLQNSLELYGLSFLRLRTSLVLILVIYALHLVAENRHTNPS